MDVYWTPIGQGLDQGGRRARRCCGGWSATTRTSSCSSRGSAFRPPPRSANGAVAVHHMARTGTTDDAAAAMLQAEDDSKTRGPSWSGSGVATRRPRRSWRAPRRGSRKAAAAFWLVWRGQIEPKGGELNRERTRGNLERLEQWARKVLEESQRLPEDIAWRLRERKRPGTPTTSGSRALDAPMPSTSPPRGAER